MGSGILQGAVCYQMGPATITAFGPSSNTCFSFPLREKEIHRKKSSAAAAIRFNPVCRRGAGWAFVARWNAKLQPARGNEKGARVHATHRDGRDLAARRGFTFPTGMQCKRYETKTKLRI